MNNNIRKYLLCTVSGLVYQLTATVCGLILPRVLIQGYGSEINGLVSSVQQFLGFIVLTEGGVGASVQASLYMPLIKGDYNTINQIQCAAHRFFGKFAFFILLYTLVLMVVYPFFAVSGVGHIYTAGLIFILSLDSLITYFIGIFYQILLRADQRQYINNFASIVTVLVKTFVGVRIVKGGFGIIFLEFALVFFSVLRTFVLVLYTRQNYDVGRKATGSGEAIKQKWNAMAQHISAFIEDNIDIMVLTLCSSLENVSVYSVYYMVKKAVSCIIVSFTGGYVPLWGNIYARGDRRELNDNFSFFQWLTYMVVTILFTDMGILVVSFVQLYTKDIHDAVYVNVGFAIVFTMAYAVLSIQGVYKGIVLAAGKFKETQMGDIIETMLNIVCSVILVFRYGIVGVALGTLIASLYKIVYLIWFLSKNIICQSPLVSLKCAAVNALGALAVSLIVCTMRFSVENFIEWGIYALLVFVLSCLLCVGINFVFYKPYIFTIVKRIKTIARK